MNPRTVFSALLLLVAAVHCAAAQTPTWKAGTACCKITPEKGLWMAGYGGRTRPAEGTLQDLWVKALALDDGQGHRAVLVSCDLLGIPQQIYAHVVHRLHSKHGLEQAQVMLCSSHTHCGPVLAHALYDIYPLDDAQRAKIEAYSKQLEEHLVTTVGQALGQLRPATLSAGEGIARFAVNRRNNREAEVPKIADRTLLKGPIDHAVPVLAVKGNDGKLLAVVLGYACHNTTLDFYRWCGDYAGFAMAELEQNHPGATALFFMGSGADQNPLPRRTAERCQRYGRELADAVEGVLRSPMKPLAPALRTAFALETLELDRPPTRAELELQATHGTAGNQRWAKRLLAEMDAGKPFFHTYPYPVQAWKLGSQLWVSLGGEVVVDYSLRLKKELGPTAWIAGYANDVMAYIPSLRVLREGGYEGNTSMMVYGMPAARWAPSIEDRIIAAVHNVVAQVQSAPATTDGPSTIPGK